MKRIKINIDKISDFDLQLARNPKILPFIDDIIKLPLDERAQRHKLLQKKIRQGKASAFEERVQVKLLEQRKAEWIRIIYKNLPAIEKEIHKRERTQSSFESQSGKSPVRAESSSPLGGEYPSELLSFLATQKPATPPPSKSSWSSQQTPVETKTQEKPPLFTTKDIIIGIVLITCLVGAFLYGLSSGHSSSNSTYPTQSHEKPTEPGMSEQEYQQAKSRFDVVAQELRFGDFEQGKTQGIELIEMFPESSFAERTHMLLADTYRQRQQHPDEAIKYYQRLIETYPDSQYVGLARLKMGYAYEDMDDAENAEHMYRLLIKQKGARSRLGQLASERLLSLQGK